MTPHDMDLTPEQAAALDAAANSPPAETKTRELPSRPGKTSELRFRQISCVPCANTSFTQTDCIMFGLDEYGQVWEKRLQDSKWQKTKMTPEEGSNE